MVTFAARADTLLLDKTGTLTEGRPELSAAITLGSVAEEWWLALAAGVERSSEHPLADAVAGEPRPAVSASNRPTSSNRSPDAASADGPTAQKSWSATRR